MDETEESYCIYIRGAIDDVRVIRATSLNDIFTWIDTAYTINSDMKNQTGGTMLLGIRVLYAKSNKKKLNIKSSTEAELVGSSKFIFYNL